MTGRNGGISPEGVDLTHGIASMVATGTVAFTDEQIEELLTDTVRQMKIGSMYDKKPRDE